jgi:hypothetical protein
MATSISLHPCPTYLHWDTLSRNERNRIDDDS